MAFRLTVSRAPDLTTVRIAGRLGDDSVTPLHEACGGAPRPIVLDLCQVTGASEAAVLLLRRLAGEGIHLIGASPYLTLLLAAQPAEIARPRRRHVRRQDPSLGGHRRGKGDRS
jgi:hypothetical protein